MAPKQVRLTVNLATWQELALMECSMSCCSHRTGGTRATHLRRHLRKPLQQPTSTQWRRLPATHARTRSAAWSVGQPPQGALRGLAVRDVNTCVASHECKVPPALTVVENDVLFISCFPDCIPLSHRHIVQVRYMYVYMNVILHTVTL